MGVGIPPGVQFDPPPALPVPVDHPPPHFAPTLGSAAELVSTFLQFERDVSQFILGGIGIDLAEAGPIGARALDPQYLVRWYKDNLKLSQVTSFIAEQEILYRMNDTVARVFNPGYFIAMSIPGQAGRFTPSIDVEGGVTNKTVSDERDALLVAQAQLSTRDPDENVFGPNRPASEGTDFTVDDMVDSAIDGSGRGTFLKDVAADSPGMPSFKRFDATKYWDKEPHLSGLHTLTRVKLAARIEAGTIQPSSVLLFSEQSPGVVRVGFHGEDLDGAVRTRNTIDPSGQVDDDLARVPLSFTDLRKDPISNTWRSVYFQAFNVNFSEGFAPEYNEQTAFGRVDPVLNYVRTVRSVNLSWEVMAFVPEDVERMYNKMTWLTSMVYPSYTADGLMQSGPVIRFRIGDVIASESGGLPGVIRNLNFDFNEALWELKRGMKVPRSFQVTAELLVLHDGPVGILDGAFGVLSLPSIGRQISGDTNMVPPAAASVQPGRFAKFGEPVRRI